MALSIKDEIILLKENVGKSGEQTELTSLLPHPIPAMNKQEITIFGRQSAAFKGTLPEKSFRLEKPRLRRILFWDTDMDKIDWTKQKKAVIKRVRERGNFQEKKEIAEFYHIPLQHLL